MAEFLTGLKRTKRCGEFTAKDIGKKAVVMGFVAKYRNLGTVLFVDLRDRTGIVQLSFNKEEAPEVFEKAVLIRNEYVVAAVGEVTPRGERNVNKNLPTGEVEIAVSEVRIVSEADTTPFNIVDDVKASELLRLKYRYLDLRRLSLQRNFIIRDQIIRSTIDYMSSKGFLYLETPFLGKSTPEGARDYLVPSRIHQSKFYALPQSPQLYKQLFMISGFDRYFQIARCFRDEDLRANRQPEFTQIDLEMSFVDSIYEVMEVAEGLIKRIFKDTLGMTFSGKFKRMKYREAMERFGSDKPDTRFEMELKDVTQAVKNSAFPAFRAAAKRGFSVRGINAKGLSAMGRKEIDGYLETVKDFKAKSLYYITMKPEGAATSLSKFLTADEISEIVNVLGGKTGDILFLVADRDEVTMEALGALRLAVAETYGLIDKSRFDLLWVTHFPLYEYDFEDKRLYAKHHPFTSPLNEDLKYMDKNPLKMRAKAYDLVINGMEAGGGSIRIHSREIQEKMFNKLGFTDQDIKERFGFFVEAFRYGVPPHGGLAFGLDRLNMIIAGNDNIKEVIAFPKNQNAVCLMSDAPSVVEDKQMKELGITINNNG